MVTASERSSPTFVLLEGVLVLDHDVRIARLVQDSHLVIDRTGPLVATDVILYAEEQVQKSASVSAIHLADARKQVPRHVSHIEPAAAVDVGGGQLGDLLQLPVELDLRPADVHGLHRFQQFLSQAFDVVLQADLQAKDAIIELLHHLVGDFWFERRTEE